MTVTKDDSGRNNVWAKEPDVYSVPKDVTETQSERAERANGRWAMMGVIAALGAYAVTGQIIPGIW